MWGIDMNFIFCDDDNVFLDTITNVIGNELRKYPIEVQITTCSSGEQLLSQIENTEPDAIFLDIDMPEMTGFHVAEKLEKMPVSPIIIFVSSKDHLVFESFSYHPFWFLRKSDLSQLSIVVEKIFAYVRNTKYMFDFEMHKQHISIALKDIRYFENHNHYVTIHTIAQSYKYKASIGEISKELTAFYFARPHVGFLVNCQYIAIISRSELKLLSGETIPIARNRLKDAQKKFIEYTRSVHV